MALGGREGVGRVSGGWGSGSPLFPLYASTESFLISPGNFPFRGGGGGNGGSGGGEGIKERGTSNFGWKVLFKK